MEMKCERNVFEGLETEKHIEHAKQLRAEAIAAFFRHTSAWFQARKLAKSTTLKGNVYEKFSMPGVQKPCH